MTRVLGIDPGLQKTGWGIVEAKGAVLCYIASGTIRTKAKDPLSERLGCIDAKLEQIIAAFRPESCAIEETFVNKNPASALKLGVARGAAFIAPARAGLEVCEYPANLVKKSIVGAGHASKGQIEMMVRTLLPQATPDSEDAADALAIALCHLHHAQSRQIMGGKLSGAPR
jgi:crossover junction endodeoxyribonuclease RuvC